MGWLKWIWRKRAVKALAKPLSTVEAPTAVEAQSAIEAPPTVVESPHEVKAPNELRFPASSPLIETPLGKPRMNDTSACPDKTRTALPTRSSALAVSASILKEEWPSPSSPTPRSSPIRRHLAFTPSRLGDKCDVLASPDGVSSALLQLNPAVKLVASTLVAARNSGVQRRIDVKDVDKRIQRMVNMDNARCYHVNTTAEGGIQLHFAPIKPDDKVAHKNAEGGRIGSRKFLRKLSEEVLILSLEKDTCYGLDLSWLRLSTIPLLPAPSRDLAHVLLMQARLKGGLANAVTNTSLTESSVPEAAQQLQLKMAAIKADSDPEQTQESGRPTKTVDRDECAHEVNIPSEDPLVPATEEWDCLALDWRCVALDCSLNRLRGLNTLPGVQLESLIALDLSANLIDSLTDVARLTPMLRCLVLCDNLLTDLQGIDKVQHLQTLDVSGNLLVSLDHLAEAPLGQLRTLRLQNNDLRSIDSLKNASFCFTLTHLDLQHNSLQSISALGSFSGLMELDCSSNSMTDLTAVRDMVRRLQNLKEFCMMGNPWTTPAQETKITIIDACPGLHTLNMMHISDLTRQQVNEAAADTALKEYTKHVAEKYSATIESQRHRVEQHTELLRRKQEEALYEFQEYSAAMKEEMEECVKQAQATAALQANAKPDLEKNPLECSGTSVAALGIPT